MKYMLPVAVAVLLTAFSAHSASAQGRFQIESRDVLSQSSLVIYTIRDSQLSTCYTLFVVEPPPPPAPALTSTEPSPTNPTLQVARAARDEQLAALRLSVAARAPFDRVSHAFEDDAARRKIEDAFEDAIRGVPMMSTLPFDSPLPGLQTGGYQYQAEEIRRSTVDPTTSRTTVDSSGRLEN